MVSDDFLSFDWNSILIFVFYITSLFFTRIYANQNVFRFVFSVLNIGAFFYFTNATLFLFGQFGRLTDFSKYFILFVLQITIFFHAISLVQKFRFNPYISILLPFILLFSIRWSSPVSIFGISFIVIRISYLAFEVHYREEKFPSFIDYINYLLYLPTLSLGPIEKYSSFRSSFSREIQINFNYFELERFILGLLKFIVLGSLAARIGFGFLGEISIVEYGIPILLVTGLFSYLSVYFQFSGFCDMMISSSRLIGISLTENFNNPLVSRNPQDHWRRWHISLMEYFREVFYYPLAIRLAQMSGGRHVTVLSILSIFIIFTLIGLWHGLGAQYLVFGWIHAAGVSWVIIFDKFKDRKELKALKSFFHSSVWSFVSWLLTLVFLSFSYIFYFYGFSIFAK